MSKIYKRDPQRGWRHWHIDEIYRGSPPTLNTALYVPNEKDIVFDGQDTFYRVDAVDEVTNIPTLTAFDPSARFSEGFGDPDNLHDGLRLYQPHIATRIFLDTTTNPPTLTTDSRYRVFGSEFTTIKFFKGRDTSPTGTVVSQTINSNGAVLGEEVDLVPITPGNSAIKRPAKCNTTYTMADGEIVTAVVYNALGTAGGEHPFIVRNAAMIAGPEASNIYIEDIELRSSRIDPADPLVIRNHLNSPLLTSDMRCRIHYSDGGYKEVAVDGTRAKLLNLSNFNTGLLGAQTHVVLSYTPNAQEQSINLTGVTPTITKTYKLKNIAVSDEHAFKLYIVPRWLGDRYALQVRLTDIDYGIDMDVTDATTIRQANNWDFNGIAFGVQQTLNLTLALDDVLPEAYPGYVHTQILKLTLDEPNSIDQDNWVIDYLGDGGSVFGRDCYAVVNTTLEKPFVISCGQLSEYDWLSRLYLSTDPIFDESLTGAPPVPTHFRLENGGEDGRAVIGTYPLSDWDKTFTLGEEREWDRDWPLNIVWLVVSGNEERTLGISPLSIEQDL